MKIALIGAKGDFTTRGADGVKRYMYELYKNLRQIHSIDVKKIEYGNLPFLYPGFSAFPQSIFDNLSGYNIIHNLDPRPILPLNKGNAIQVTTIHDFHGILRPEKEDSDDVRRILGRYLVLVLGLKLALKNSDYLICNSSQTKNEAIRLGYDKKKIFVTPLGIDNRFIIKPVKKRNRSKVFKVGYIGSLSTTKNVAFAIKAFKQLKGIAVFEIWGKQDRTYNELKRLSESDKRIKFMGFAPEGKLIEIYDSFDVFVHPTLYEGFGLPILEAQSRGLPVIIYKKAIIPNEARRYCIEANSPEHMARIMSKLKSNCYNEKQRKRATKYAQYFTWKRTATTTLNIYKKICSNTGTK